MPKAIKNYKMLNILNDKLREIEKFEKRFRTISKQTAILRQVKINYKKRVKSAYSWILLK